MEPISHEQAATLANVSIRRLYQICDDEPNGPKRSKPGHFDCAEFGEWLARRNSPDNFQAERTRLTRAQADKAELEADELRGRLVPIDIITRLWAELVASWRAKLLAFPSKIAQRIAPPEQMPDVQKQAQRVVHEILNEFASDGLPDSVRERYRSSMHDVESAAGSDGESVGGPPSKIKPRVKRGAGGVGHLDS